MLVTQTKWSIMDHAFEIDDLGGTPVSETFFFGCLWNDFPPLLVLARR